MKVNLMFFFFLSILYFGTVLKSIEILLITLVELWIHSSVLWKAYVHSNNDKENKIHMRMKKANWTERRFKLLNMLKSKIEARNTTCPHKEKCFYIILISPITQNIPLHTVTLILTVTCFYNKIQHICVLKIQDSKYCSLVFWLVIMVTELC